MAPKRIRSGPNGYMLKLSPFKHCTFKHKIEMAMKSSWEILWDCGTCKWTFHRSTFHQFRDFSDDCLCFFCRKLSSALEFYMRETKLELSELTSELTVKLSPTPWDFLRSGGCRGWRCHSLNLPNPRPPPAPPARAFCSIEAVVSLSADPTNPLPSTHAPADDTRFAVSLPRGGGLRD